VVIFIFGNREIVRHLSLSGTDVHCQVILQPNATRTQREEREKMKANTQQQKKDKVKKEAERLPSDNIANTNPSSETSTDLHERERREETKGSSTCNIL